MENKILEEIIDHNAADKIVLCEECKIINTNKCIYAIKNNEMNDYKTDVKSNDYCYHGKK